MKKVIFIVLPFCFFSMNLSIPEKMNKFFQEEKNRIQWSNERKLTWEDFRGTPPKNRGNKIAETFGEIVTDSSYWDNDIPKFIVKCYFLKDKSWTTTDASITLEHEQIHFDIYEVYTRKIRKAFDSLNNNGVRDFTIYQDQFNKYLMKNRECNKEYDNEAQFDGTIQKKWIKKVERELCEMDKFQ